MIRMTYFIVKLEYTLGGRQARVLPSVRIESFIVFPDISAPKL